MNNNNISQNTTVYKINHKPENIKQVIEYVTSCNPYPTIILVCKVFWCSGTLKEYVENTIAMYEELCENYVVDYYCSMFLFIRKTTYNDNGYMNFAGNIFDYRFYSTNQIVIKTYLNKHTDRDIKLHIFSDDTYGCEFRENHDDDIALINKIIQVPTLVFHNYVFCEKILETVIFQENKYTKLYKDNKIIIYLLEKKPLVTKRAMISNK